MGVVELLSPEHVSVASPTEGAVHTKAQAIHRLSQLLASEMSDVSSVEIERVLSERESIQSTGVGGGVAIPHGEIDRLDGLTGAVLLCPSPIDFDAIDNAPV